MKIYYHHLAPLLFLIFSVTLQSGSPSISFVSVMVAHNPVSNGTQTVDVNMEHKILFREQTLHFLFDCRSLKRPPTSLRIKGLNCFPEDIQRELLSNFESIALEKAIQLKMAEIKDLEKEFADIPTDEYHLYNPPDAGDLTWHNGNLSEKNDWLYHLSETRFSDWPEKEVIRMENREKRYSATHQECWNRKSKRTKSS